jgi:hypothetical protein
LIAAKGYLQVLRIYYNSSSRVIISIVSILNYTKPYRNQRASSGIIANRRALFPLCSQYKIRYSGLNIPTYGSVLNYTPLNSDLALLRNLEGSYIIRDVTFATKPKPKLAPSNDSTRIENEGSLFEYNGY